MAILRALGRPAPGFNPLDDFPDLKARVEGQEILEADAIALANARRADAVRRQQQGQQSAQQQSAETVKKAQEGALAGIEKWTKQMAADDIDYKKKEEQLLGETLDGVIKDYPPQLWLPAKRLYKGITIMKEAGSAQHKAPRPMGGDRGRNSQPTWVPGQQGLGYPERAAT